MLMTGLIDPLRVQLASHVRPPRPRMDRVLSLGKYYVP